ncbi:MAG TPA: TatD family hydrolase [Armatimonadota bacterium]|nr:TatD family hydrolase [Armatimonadota bacterium]
MLIDSHAHLTDKRLMRDLGAVLRRAAEAEVEAIVSVGADLPSSRAVVELADGLPGIAGTVGVHPHDARTVTAEVLEELARLAAHPRIVAIGETGLDFYRDLSPRDRQVMAFIEQIHLARELDLPLVIHSRDAYDEVLGILERECGGQVRGVVHCWSSGLEHARRALDLGLHIGFTGTVTYPNARDVRETAASIPLDRVLVETDCPYLVPQRYRKKVKTNEPAYVVYVAEEIAALRGIGFDEVARITTQSANELFGLTVVRQTS